MRLPKFAIDHHQFTVVVIALLVLSGVVSFITMPWSEDPQFSVPGSDIVVVYPGAGPVDLEQLVIDPIEEVVNELEDIKVIASHAEDDLAIVSVEFEIGSDADDKHSDVMQKVNSIVDDLPDDILDIDMYQWSITDVNILVVALISGTADYRELEKEAERLVKRFELVPGVQGATARAFPEQEIRVSLDTDRMSALRISMNRVVGAISAAGADIPGGSIDIGGRRFSVHTSGDFESIEDIARTIVGAHDGRLVYLEDVADVALGYEDRSYIARFNGRRALLVTVAQKEGTNIFAVMKRLKAELTEFQRRLPADMELAVTFDQSASVSKRVFGFFGNFIQGIVLVGLVVLLALGRRAAAIVMLAVPFSIMIAVGFVDAGGFGIQQMTIVGLVIALGLLVDNAIVVVENTTRFLSRGEGRVEAAVRGTDQIGWAIVSATATTLLAFVPLAMLRSTAGDFMRSMPVTVILVLSASLLIALTLTPYLSSSMLRPVPAGKHGFVRRMLDRFISRRYRRMLEAAMRRPRTTVAIALIVLVSSLLLFPVVGFSLFPKSGKRQLMINVSTPDGTSIDGTDEVVRYVESVLADREEVLHYTANVGHGNPRIYYNVIPERNKSNHGQVFVQLDKIGLGRMTDLIYELRATFREYPGALIEVKEFEQGPPVDAPVAIRVVGDDLERLTELAAMVEGTVESTPGTVNVGNPLRTMKTDVQVEIDRDKAAMAGVPLVDIDRSIRAAIAGMPVSTYRDREGKEYDVVVRLPAGEKAGIDDFDSIWLTTATGAQMPLKQLARIELKASPPEINHYKLERFALITADVMDGYSVDAVTKEIIGNIRSYSLPRGCRFSVGGELESRTESFSGLLRAIVVAVVGIFAVLVLQFRSYRQPLIVFSAIPLAVVGSLIALFLSGYNFSFTAFVGLAGLVGIVVNNSIILVDYTNKLRRDGADLTEALREAGETRFTPIILTTATTICGLLPLTLAGGSLWAPMGWTIIGGLTLSTILTLIIVPVLYLLAERERSRR